jgi:hypothetical protein
LSVATLSNKEGNYEHLVERAGSCLSEVWDFPAGWETSVDAALRSFVQALRTANVKAYNERYHENEPVRILSFTPRAPFNTIDLIKALHCIRYNIDDQNVKGNPPLTSASSLYISDTIR